MRTRSEADSPETRPRRRLIWVPIVHTQEDMGALRESVKNLYVHRLGKNRWDTHLRTVDVFWQEIRQTIESLRLDYPRTRLYQDGLPVCDQEEKIVRELAGQGSINHRLLVNLMDRGAQLTGTESPQLLVQEYELNRRILGVDGPARPAAIQARLLQEEARQLLAKRDQFIAGRIGETLQSDEQGLIFLGMLHSLDRRLPADIHVTKLRPGDRASSRSSRPV